MVEARRENNLYFLNVNVWRESDNVAKSLNEGCSHLNMVSFKKLEKMVNGMNLKEVPLHHV